VARPGLWVITIRRMPCFASAIDLAPPNKALQLTPNSSPLSMCGTVLVAGLCAEALAVSAVWCSLAASR
jgi:hypothetical protein